MASSQYRSSGKISLDLVGLVVRLADQPDYGILHLYRGNDDNIKQGKEQKDNTAVTSENTTKTNATSTIVCSLDVPSYLTVPEFLSFVEPVDSFVSHYRIIR